MNKVILIGRLGADPEVREVSKGSVATFTVATDRRWKGRDGESRKETDWHRVVCWGRQAEIAEKYLTKGRQVAVEGRMQTRSWEDRKTGEKKYRTEVVCSIFEMLGDRPDRGGNGRPTTRDRTPTRSRDRGGPDWVSPRSTARRDDEIPF